MQYRLRVTGEWLSYLSPDPITLIKHYEIAMFHS